MKVATPFLIAAVLLLPGVARADITLLFNSTFSNSTVPAGSAPWLTAVFHTVDATHVQLTMTNQLQDPNEFISHVYFNVLGDVSAVSPILPFTGTGAASADDVLWGPDCCSADGGGFYDIDLLFNSSNSGDRFSKDDTVGLTFFRALASGGLSETDFLTRASKHGGSGPFYAAAHVQSIATTGQNSTYIAGELSAVPEPASIVLLATMLTGSALVLRRRRAA